MTNDELLGLMSAQIAAPMFALAVQANGGKLPPESHVSVTKMSVELARGLIGEIQETGEKL